MQPGAGQQLGGRKDYWGDALASLEKRRQDRIKQELLCKEDPISWPDVISQICREQNGHQTRERKLRFAGREIDLRKMMDSWSEFLDKMRQVGNATIDVNHIHAGLPWAAVRLILKAVIASKEQSAAIYIGIGKVLVLMNRGAAYELQLSQLDENLLAASRNFEASLIKLYAGLLEFLASALLVQDENALERTFHALWTPKDITRFGEHCIELEKALDFESQLIDRGRNKETSENVKMLLNSTKFLEKIITDTQTLLGAFKLEEQEGCDNQDALHWVSKIPVLDHHSDAKSGRAPGTGQWVFEKPEFLGWDRTTNSSFLWIHGIPGAGKTKLVSSVVDHFLQLQEAGLESRLDEKADSDASRNLPSHNTTPTPSTISLAFFYCRRTNAERRKPENILRSYIKQLAVMKDKSLDLLRRKYLEKKQRGFLSNVLGPTEAQDLLAKMIKQNSQTILVLDALDECEEDSRHSLMTVLSELVEQRLRVKVLISSRRDDDITAEFENKDNFNISATDNGDDIMSFVRGKINEYRHSSIGRRRASSVISEGLEQHIIEVFLDKSNGMFQWAAMHISHLLSLHRSSDIAKALPNLPRGLEKTYDEIFNRIMSQEEGLRDIALRTFHWMLSQDGTSDLEQLLVAVCQNPDGDELCPADLDPDVVLKACQNLVVEEGRYVSAHEPLGIQGRDELDSLPPHYPNRNSRDFFTYACSRIPQRLWPERCPNCVSIRFRSRSPSEMGPPPPPPPSYYWPWGEQIMRSFCRDDCLHYGHVRPLFPGPHFRHSAVPGPLPGGIQSLSASPPPPSSPALRPPTSGLHPHYIQPPPPTPSWATTPLALFMGQAWPQRRQLRFAHLSVQEYCETLRWTPQVSHCFAAKICLLFLSHLELQEDVVPGHSSADSSLERPWWREDDLRNLPSLELALTKCMFRNVRDFADSFWIYHAQRSCSQVTVCQDKKLVTALANFVGFPGKTSRAFELWLHRFNMRSHVIWHDATLLPAFWSVNDNRRTATLERITPNKLQFYQESRLVVCFFGLDRIFLPSVVDVAPIWGTELVSRVNVSSSDNAYKYKSIFSHMSWIPSSSLVLKNLPDEIRTKILWGLVNAIEKHPLEEIYRSSFLDYSTLCLNLADLIHLVQDSNRNEMFGKLVCSLLSPSFSRPMSFSSDSRLWKVVSKLSARGANLELPFLAAILEGEWHNIPGLIECGYKLGTNSLALVLAGSPYTRYCPPLDLCHALVDHGGDVNADYRDLDYEEWHLTPLIAACILGAPALVEWLLSAKANVNVKPMRGDHERMQLSSLNGQVSNNFQQQKTISPSINTELESVRLRSRLEEDTVPDKIWYSTPLIEACARGHKDIFLCLTTAGANIHAVMEPYVGRFGTALVAACSNEYPDICWILLDDPTVDITMATWRILRARPRYLKDLDSLYSPVYTNPLVAAASSGLHKICRRLIERGVDVNAVPLDKTGEFRTEGTALIKASACSHLGVCKLLVKHGADVNIVLPEAAHYPTALFAAAKHGRTPIIKWLLHQGAEINKILLSELPNFCAWIIRNMVTVKDNKKILSLQDFPEKGLADDHGMITVELASTLFSLGIHINQDAIKTGSPTANIEPLLGSEPGSEPSEAMRESSSQQAGSVNQRVIFRFPADFIYGKYGDEMRGYSLEIFYLAIFFLMLGGTTAGIWKHYTSSKA
ncbi:hypothetical protein L207DRAFT_572327 [Hyaloscypha variabilis F]|uniref:Nephrocystin 3-like N-terminal domain-containing protein n=1 Tax=Hyaloscypha variabilis (strain UAMH 11265 / GT02V1 / F) TaxID=1149755 RepID=A0A2J6R0I1_HYAVF|nr:hypothetical protein L207DRAFT_572327 [Hyaloscypha variabilis F]